MRTIRIKGKKFGPNHMVVAVSLNDLAQPYYLEGRFAEAEPLYRRALSISAEIERVHPLTSAVLFNNVAELFSVQGRSAGTVTPRLAACIDSEEAAADAPKTGQVEQTATTQTAPGPAEGVIVVAVAEAPPEPAEEIIVAAAAAAVPCKLIDIRAAEREPVEITVEDSAVEIMVVPPAETLPETLADASEEIEITADTAKTEPPPEPDVAAVVEIAKTVMEQAKIQKQAKTALEQPIAETVVAAVEPEPQRELKPVPEPGLAPAAEKIPAQPAELPVEEAARESVLPSEAEVERARIDAVLDVSRENQAPGALPEEDAAEVHFDLAGVIIGGSSIYSASELLPSYRRFLGQDVQLNDLYKISQAITARRRR